MAGNGSKLTTSMFWSFAQTVGSQLIGIIISTILARLMVPEAYGIIAAAHVLTGIATTFVSGGFASSIIQKKNADSKDLDTMFWWNVAFSLVLYCILFVSAPGFVKLFDESFDRALLTAVIRVLGIGVVLSSFNSFYQAVLQKRLHFKKIFFITLSGTIVSAVVGIAMAYNGAGVWALVTQNILSYLLNSLFFVLFARWKPRLCFSFYRFRSMFSYGFKMLLSGLTITIYQDMTQLAIGSRYSSENLAFYNKGTNYPKLLALNIITSINTALFPVMSRIEDPAELKKLVRKFNRISAFVMTPMMFGFAAVAPAFVELLLTEKWSLAIPFLQLCCINYAIQPLGMSSLQYLKATGRATEYLVLDIIRKVIGVLLLLGAVFLNKGVIYIALAEIVSNFLAIFVNFYPGKKHIGYCIHEQIWDVLPKFVLSGVVFAVVCFVGAVYLPLPVKMIVQIITGVTIYVVCAKLLKMKELDEVLELAKRIIKKREGL